MNCLKFANQLNSQFCLLLPYIQIIIMIPNWFSNSCGFEVLFYMGYQHLPNIKLVQRFIWLAIMWVCGVGYKCGYLTRCNGSLFISPIKSYLVISLHIKCEGYLFCFKYLHFLPGLIVTRMAVPPLRSHEIEPQVKSIPSLFTFFPPSTSTFPHDLSAVSRKVNKPI